jgi:hypothetical protein
MSRIRHGLVIVGSLLLGSVLFAAPLPDPMGEGTGEIGFDIGAGGIDSDVAAGDGVRFAVRGGYNLTRHLEVEGQLAATNEGDLGDGDIPLATAFVNAVFEFPNWKRTMIPYFLLGAGAGRVETAIDDDTGVAYQVAGGVEAYGPERRVGLRLEGGFTGVDAFDSGVEQFNLMVGLTWRLGGPERPREQRPPWAQGSWPYSD